MQIDTNTKHFFFVNNSEGSIRRKRCLPQEKAIVQSYLQTGRSRHRHVKHTRVATTGSNPLKRSQKAPTEIDLQAVSSNVDETGDSGALSKDETRDSDLASDHNTFPSDLPLLLAPLTYYTILSKRDPFDAASVPINQSVAGLLHYYMYHYHPSLWPNELILLHQGVYVFPDSVLDIIKTAIADKLAMYSLLSASVCRLRFIDQLPFALPADTDSHYIGKALRLMATYIATASFQTLNEIKQCVICMIYLSSAESYRGDLLAAKAHLVPTAQILRPLGGLAYIEDDNLKGQLAMADLAIASVNLEPCLYDCSYDPGPASTLNLQPGELHFSYPTSTVSSLLERSNSFIPNGLKTLIEALAESHSVKSQIVTASMLPARAIEVTHWISLRNMAIRNRLLAFRTVDPRVHALRVALIMWSLSFNISGRIRTVKMMAPKLQSILAGISSASWTNNVDLHLWLALLGLYCATEGSKESIWFMNECCSMSVTCGLSNTANNTPIDMVEQLESFQLKFFYDTPVQNPQTRIFAEELLSVPSDPYVQT